MQDTIERVWTCNPSPERIVQDILRWAETLQKIINHQGVAVSDNNRRHGHRAIPGPKRRTEPESRDDLHVHSTLRPVLDAQVSEDAAELKAIVADSAEQR